MRASQPALITEGAHLGSYRVLARIGHGGMGEVWLAEHSLLKRRAAIKLLRPSVSNNEEMVTRFFNEARAATQISDPGIVQIFDYGHHDGVAYIVMELLEGETLDKRRERVSVFTVDDALRFMRQVASSLGAAHVRQIVHRDLKPENIFLVRDPEVPGGERAKILDFGIAKLTHDEVALKTQTAAVMGTPLWMSPEQCRGAGGVDQRSDIYSLGCVLYLLLTGQPPFEAEGFGELFAKHLYEAPRPPSHLVASIPLDVEAVIMRCLAKDPANRYENGAALAAALDTAHKRSSQSGLVPATMYTVPPPSRRPHPTTLTEAASVIQSPPPKRTTGIVMIGLAALAVIGGVVTFAVMRRGAKPTATPAAIAPPPDLHRERATRQIATTVAAFVKWTTTHPTEPCPTASQLVERATDPWGHELAITCTDQPSDQIVGVISLGPDGTLGTRDDLASWRLDPETIELGRGARWAPAPVVAAPEAPKPKRSTSRMPPSPKTKAGPKPKSEPLDGTSLGADGIPTSR